MTRIEPFEKYYKEYDEWFINNPEIYSAELNAIKSLIPCNKSGIEIGVGTGRFAQPLGIIVGVEPSKKMADISRKQGIKVYEGVAEQLPLADKTFDFVLFVTTICFVDDLTKSLKEAHRVLKNNGFIIIGFVDKESELGKQYQLKRGKSNFYIDATFYSTEEVLDYLKNAGFSDFSIKQTILIGDEYKMSHIKDGFGEGSFVIIKANKN
jgi:SAM-dependent methyltransferase